MDIGTIVNITSRAWSLPILSSMHRGIPGRQATLRTATGATRTAFTQSMDHLIKIGMLERNPGHGHPLRPEFRLTQSGSMAAAIAHQIQNVTEVENHELLRRSWIVPILTSLHSPRHFNDIKRSLPAITDRALSLSLKSMEDKNWVHRSVQGANRPPRSIYRAVNTGCEISNVTGPNIRFAEQN